MSGMRNLVMEAVSMKNAGKDPGDIRYFLWKGVNSLAVARQSVMAEMNEGENYEMRLVNTGEVIACNSGAYSYRSN